MIFKKARITKSRLMGSMGLIIEWDDNGDTVVQYFLLDAEGLGICDYVSLYNPSVLQAYREEERLMGGLGSERINISENIALTLIRKYGIMNMMFEKPLPGNAIEYADIIENFTDCSDRDLVMNTICKDIESVEEFVNYMMMRLVSKDFSGLSYFSSNDILANTSLTESNATLLYNKVTDKGHGNYLSTCLIEDMDIHYQAKVMFKVNTDENRGLKKYMLDSIMVFDKVKIPSGYIYEKISKPEYVSIYKLKNCNDFSEILHSNNPSLYKVEIGGGTMFTRFNLDNSHVNRDVYIINNDVNRIYYIKDNMLYIGIYDYDDLRRNENLISFKYEAFTERVDTIYFETNALYDFAESGESDFFRYFGIEIEKADND